MTRRPPKPLNIKELEKIKILHASGLSYHAVAVQVNRDPKTVKKACIEPHAAKHIREIKQELADMYENLAQRMIKSINDGDIQNINAYQRILSSGIAVDKMRLLREQSTQNLSLSAIIRETVKFKSCKDD